MNMPNRIAVHLSSSMGLVRLEPKLLQWWHKDSSPDNPSVVIEPEYFGDREGCRANVQRHRDRCLMAAHQHCLKFRDLHASLLQAIHSSREVFSASADGRSDWFLDLRVLYE
jgi:hypothetical protein